MISSKITPLRPIPPRRQGYIEAEYEKWDFLKHSDEPIEMIKPKVIVCNLEYSYFRNFISILRLDIYLQLDLEGQDQKILQLFYINNY